MASVPQLKWCAWIVQLIQRGSDLLNQGIVQQWFSTIETSIFGELDGCRLGWVVIK
jgi:hypothetical protein